MKRSTISVALLCLLALLAQPFTRTARAQIASSELSGVVTDSSKAGVPNAKVTITSRGTGFTRTVFTNAVGEYTIAELAPGAYDITVEARGFKNAIVSNTNLYVGRTITQDFQLEVGAQLQTVTVEAQAPLLTTTNGQLGTLIAGAVVNQLPLNGRNFMQLGMLSPGTIVNKNGANSIGATYSPSAIVWSVNGHATNYNMYLLDGVSMKDFEDGPTTFQPSVEALQEFQSTTSNYSAVYGTEATAQVNLVSKSGTNQFHGAGWDFLRNDDLDAANFFQGGPAPAFKRNQAGGNIGGPVRFPHYNGKDQTFFFFNYETYRQLRLVPETAEYPTLSELEGNLSPLVPNGGLTNPLTGTVYAGSIIPTTSFRPTGLAGFLQNGIGNGPWIPAPNVTGQAGYNYRRSDKLNYFDDQYITRIDRKLTNNSTLYGHFTFDKQSRDDPNAHPNWRTNNEITTYNLGGHYTHTFGPSLAFDTAVGYSHFMQSVLVDSTPGKFNITQGILGISGGCTAQECWEAPGWSVTGYSALGENFRQPRSWWVNSGEVRPTFTWSKGNHFFRFGMDLLRLNENFPEILNDQGSYSFNGAESGNPLGDFLLDLPLSVSIAPEVFSPDVYTSDLEPYFQDDWRVTKKLTINLGLRYVHVGIPFSNNGRSIPNIYFPANGGVPQVVVSNDAHGVNFMGTQEPLFPASVTGVPYVTASSVGLPDNLVFNDNKDWSPRFGFAYRLGQNSVVRGGYGVFYSFDMIDKFVEASVGLPFIDSTSVTLGPSNIAQFDPQNPFANFTSAAAAQFFGIQTNHHMAKSSEWNLTLEQTWHNTIFSLAYVGVTSQHIADAQDPNQAVPGPGAVIPRRPWPTVGSMTIAAENGNSNYNGLQFHAQHNFSHGMALISSYSYQKTMDDGQGVGVGEGGSYSMNELNPTGPSQYGLAGQDIRQRFTVSYLYELPVGRGKRFLNSRGPSDWFLGGWQLNGITSANTGSPLTETQSFNIDNSDAGTNRPDAIGNPNDLPHNRPRGQQIREFFDTAAYRQADLTNGTYRFGNEGRNAIIGPGTYDWDFAIFKNFQFREKLKGQFRAESFNLFNRPIFAQPSSTLGTSTNATISSTSNDSREIQLAIRLSF